MREVLADTGKAKNNMSNRGSSKPSQKITASFEEISYINKLPIETVIHTYSLWKSYKMKLMKG